MAAVSRDLGNEGGAGSATLTSAVIKNVALLALSAFHSQLRHHNRVRMKIRSGMWVIKSMIQRQNHGV